MSEQAAGRPGIFKALPWGISIALSWTWGLGLFFSVQMALQFGLMGLLLFAIPNAIGLTLFGFLTHRIAQRLPNSKDFERHFFTTSHYLRYVIIAYQFTAIALTFFAAFNYLFVPIGTNMGLVILLMLGGALILGEHFDIARLKWTHTLMFLLIILSAAGLVLGFGNFLQKNDFAWELAPGHESAFSLSFLGFFVPILAGFLVGPWLDLQQWQRAIQIHREGGSVRLSYLFGGPIFFLILIFHGVFALSVLSVAGAGVINPSPDGLFHAKEAVSNFLFQSGIGGWFLQTCYILFVLLCVFSTLDSGYVSLKWYLRQLTRKSQHVILSIVPEDVVASPVLPYLLAVGTAAVGVMLNFELEYFMSFYASFSVGYALVFLFRTTYRPEFTNFTQTTLFSIAIFSLGLFGIGYFEKHALLMMAGALIPIIHGFLVISSRVVVDDIQKALPRSDSTDMVPTGSVSGKAAEKAVTALEQAITRFDPKAGEKFRSAIHKIEPTAAQAIANILHSIEPIAGGGTVQARPLDENSDIEHAKGHRDGKWYCHTFMATYSDTNSVGNVYFGNYIIWVGKVREMFFASCMPDFDLKNTPFFILTRQIEHKFNLESREFEIVTVRIRVGGFNRKFVTLEHEILNQGHEVLGKGKQILMFVNSKDYRLVDLPGEVRTAFLPYC